MSNTDWSNIKSLNELTHERARGTNEINKYKRYLSAKEVSIQKWREVAKAAKLSEEAEIESVNTAKSKLNEFLETDISILRAIEVLVKQEFERLKINDNDPDVIRDSRCTFVYENQLYSIVRLPPPVRDVIIDNSSDQYVFVHKPDDTVEVMSINTFIMKKKINCTLVWTYGSYVDTGLNEKCVDITTGSVLLTSKLVLGK